MRTQLLLVAVFSVFVSCQRSVVRVLCFGDSITQGKVAGDTIKELSYRYWLWEKLDSAGYRVDMIGSNSNWFTEDKSNPLKRPVSPYTGHTFDNDHEGYYGIKTGETLKGGFTHDNVHYARLHERLEKIAAPDCAFIHIGTNDGKADSLTTINSLKQILEELYLRNTSMHIFLAKLNTPWVYFVNNAIESLVMELKSRHPKIKLTFVDMAAGWINCPEAPGSMTLDWVHPNVAGQKMMAEHWFKAYKSIGDKRKPSFQTSISLTGQTDSTATISWLPATDNRYIAGYDVLLDGKKVNWHRSGCGNNTNPATTLVPDTQFQLIKLKKGTPYTVRLMAWDYANNSQLSKPFIIKM
jgi:lysophospholipase L1-like esterase